MSKTLRIHYLREPVGERLRDAARLGIVELFLRELRSEYRESLRELLEAKLAGHEIEIPEQEEPAQVVDLMEALKASVAAASAKQPEAAPKKKAAPRKRAAASK